MPDTPFTASHRTKDKPMMVCNQNADVYYTGGTANAPQVKNCIVWRNAQSDGFIDIEGDAEITCCCLTDPNNPDTVIDNPSADEAGNIITAPGFAYIDLNLNNFHLAYNAPCVDAGNPNETDIDTEVDMDSEIRIYGISVDIGADEAFACDDDLSENDIYDSMDWNADGIVNYGDFAIVSHAWLAVGNADPNFSDPNYNPVCDLDSDWDVDPDDLMLFTPHWLWQACWRHDITNYTAQAAANSESLVASEQSLTSASLESENVSELSAATTSLTVTASAKTFPAAVETIPAEEDSVDVSALLETIETFIDSGGDDANLWREVKNLLQQSFVESEDTASEAVEG
jgi:hypothetical protein